MKKLQLDCLVVPYGLVVRIPAFHAGGPGSIPGVGILLLFDCGSHFDEAVSHDCESLAPSKAGGYFPHLNGWKSQGCE